MAGGTALMGAIDPCFRSGSALPCYVAMIDLPDVVATRRFGRALATVLAPGDVVALVGDLGVGKTTLVDACVREFGGDGASSPTFALIHEYPCRDLAIWHVDLYRIDRFAELAELGLEEILGNVSGIAFVEWADKHDVLPRAHLRLTLAHVGAGRTVEIDGVGVRGGQLAQNVRAAVARGVGPANG